MAGIFYLKYCLNIFMCIDEVPFITVLCIAGNSAVLVIVTARFRRRNGGCVEVERWAVAQKRKWSWGHRREEQYSVGGVDQGRSETWLFPDS